MVPKKGTINFMEMFYLNLMGLVIRPPKSGESFTFAKRLLQLTWGFLKKLYFLY
jgi:hypothetical protein